MTLWVAGSPVVRPSTIIMGVGEMTGVYFLSNFLLRRGSRPEPSTRTTHWSNCRISTTMNVLSHLVGWGPVWFWIRTVSPPASGERTRVCSDSHSAARKRRFLSASSLDVRVSRQVVRGWYLPGWGDRKCTWLGIGECSGWGCFYTATWRVETCPCSACGNATDDSLWRTPQFF